MLYEIHYRARPAWLVPGTDGHYHDDYAGKVLGVREVGSDLPSLRHMADKDRPVIELDLTPGERARLASRERKIEAGLSAAVTCDDRWGHVATIMRSRDRDPDAWETDSREAVKQAERDNHLAQMSYDADVSVYNDRTATAILLEQPMPESPVPPVLAEVRDSFSEEAVRIARALPPPDVHTGTGLYSTKATPTHNDDTQSGAPAAQVVTLVTGGLGTADAFKGGYVQTTISDAIWEEKAPQEGAETVIHALAVFNDKLYGGTASNGKLFEWNGTNAWVEKAPKLGTETGIFSLAVFNGKLYGGTGPTGRLYEWNGTNAWVEKAAQSGAEEYIWALAVFNGKLYGSTSPNGKLLEWNGTNAWVEKAPKEGIQGVIWSLAVFNGKLYGGTDPDGKLYEWNGTNAWVEKAPKEGAETQIRALAVFNSKLYGGTGATGKLYEWNGTNAWVEKAPQEGAETYIRSLAVFNNRLYGGTSANGKLFEWNGTNAWVEKAAKLGAEAGISALAVFDNKLYGGTTSNGKLYEWGTRVLRAVVSHTDDAVTLEGDLTGWAAGNDLDVYDAWSTIQGHLDQLWTDQSTVWFTAPQKCRTYAGTYDENAVVNAAMNFKRQYPLIIEGDPADDRANIIIAPSAGTRCLYFNRLSSSHRIIVRHLTFAGSPTVTLVEFECLKIVEDCVFVANGVDCLRTPRYRVRVSDCDFTQLGAASAIKSDPNNNPHILVENCKIAGAGVGLGIQAHYATYALVRGCSISGFGIGIGGSFSEGLRDIRNCTIYNCTYAVSGGGGYSAEMRINLYNNIVHTVNYVYYDTGTHPPEETSTYVGPRVVMRNNCFYNYTTQFWRSGTLHTYAQIAAMNRVDAAGDLDATDPLLTDPGAGDFSLQAASPCRHAGHGSGVPSDVDGDAFDKYHPDIGAVSTGIWAGPQAPTVTIADDATGTSLTLTITAASTEDELDTYHAYYRLTRESSWTVFGSTRTGSGDLQVTGLTADLAYEMIVLPERYTRYGPPSSPVSEIPTTALAASGRISEPIENLRTLLADSGNFQTMTGAANAAAAKASIHLPAVDDAKYARPCAILALGDDWRDTAVAGGGSFAFAATENLSIILEQDISSGYRPDDKMEEAFLEFTNRVGGILADMEALTGTSTYLVVDEFSWKQKPMRTPKSEEKRATPFYQAVIAVRRGVSE